MQVARAGGLASATYGTRVTGMSTTKLQQVRTAVGQAVFGTPKGRWRTLEFLLSVEPRADSTYDANMLPVFTWGQAARQQWAEPKAMQQSFQFFASQAEFDWSQVRGPAGAVALAIRRLNWTSRNWCKFVTRSGLQIDISELGFRSLKAVLEKDVRDELIISLGEGTIEGLKEGPLIEPIIEVLRTLRAKGRHQAAAGLAGVVSGGLPYPREIVHGPKSC